jgi:murein DD-endopeptidase MepM/ murein hydrolase activator NlpD
MEATMSEKWALLAWLVLFGSQVHAQAHANACQKLVVSVAPTDVAKTFMRKGFGEFGASRKGGESLHKGVDITRSTSDSDPEATAVYAVAAGKIAYSRVNGSATTGYGNLVVVDHGNGCYSAYAHLASKPFTPSKPGGDLLVKVADKVTAGQKIGYFVDIKADTTSTGNAVSTDPAAREQVHFQMMEAPSGRGASIGTILGSDGVVVDPTPFLKSKGLVSR